MDDGKWMDVVIVECLYLSMGFKDDISGLGSLKPSEEIVTEIGGRGPAVSWYVPSRDRRLNFALHLNH